MIFNVHNDNLVNLAVNFNFFYFQAINPVGSIIENAFINKGFFD
jgi:hypothetical protein